MTLRLEINGPIARLIIDRADKRNAFNQAMWEQLPLLLNEADSDPSVRVIILQSAADGIFCAGADIRELMTHKDDADWRAANQLAINAAQFALARADKPTIAMIDGDAVGGGCGLAIACDMRMATARSRIGITPAKLGLVYPLHDTKLLVDLIGPGQAKKMLFTGQLLSAEAALAIGLIEMIADDARDSDDLAMAIAANSAFSTLHIKQFVRRILDGQSADNEETLTVFADAFTAPDFLEGSSAFLEKRKARFQ